jgi:hypothetical protein
MLNITYAPDDADLAERIQKDLTTANETLDGNILIVLVSPTSVQDKSVLKAINSARSDNHIILPVMVSRTDLPDTLKQFETVDLTKGYQFSTLLAGMRRAIAGQDTRRKNMRIAWVLLALITLSFVASIVGLMTGMVGVPVDEFNTEAAIQESMIETLTFPTLDPLMPRTTQDAENFPMTVEAANTRNAPLLMMTATALPLNLQATQDAIATAADMTSTARAEGD